MATASQEVQALALKAAAQRLSRAASFAALHATGKPLFQKTMKQPGGATVVVRLNWPCVLQVFDPVTGDLLAESVPGRPDVLACPDL